MFQNLEDLMFYFEFLFDLGSSINVGYDFKRINQFTNAYLQESINFKDRNSIDNSRNSYIL